MALSNTSVAMAQILSQSLGAKGIELQPKAETPVAILTDLSTTQLKLNESAIAREGGFERPNLTVSLLSGAEEPMPGTDVSAHTLQMNDSVQLLTRVLNHTLNLAQNTVNPMIERVVAKIGESIDAAVQASASPLDLIQQRQDPILDSHYLLESAGRYVNQRRDVPLRSLGLPAGDVLERLLTGHAGMDEQLRGFIDRVGVEFAASVWDRVFNSTPVNSMDVFARPSQAKEAVCAYFFAAKALTDVPAGLNMDLSEWRAYASSILAAAGASIVASADDRAAQRKTGRLVISCPPEQQPVGAIVVDGEKYSHWIEAGGSPELIFATAYGDRNFDPQRMIERAESLKAEWDRIVAFYQNAASFKRFDAMVSGMKAQLTTEINAIPDDELVGSREDYHERLRERCAHAKQRDLEELWYFALKAVCRVVFPHTDVESLLLAIDEQDKIHPGKPARELALYATIELVARWLVGQLTPQAHLPQH